MKEYTFEYDTLREGRRQAVTYKVKKHTLSEAESASKRMKKILEERGYLVQDFYMTNISEC